MYFFGENGYLNLLKEALDNGEIKATRNGNVISIFGCMTNFKNISSSFPLITTKRMFFRGIVEELLWFLRGSTNANELKQKNIHIWDGNSSRQYLDSIGLNYPEGELGPVYGWQWRKFGKAYETETYTVGSNSDEDIYNDITDTSDSSDSSNTSSNTSDSSDSLINYIYPEASNSDGADPNGADQIKYVIEELSKDNNSRRAVLSGWNPTDLKKMALPPCHILYIFNRSSKGLSCHMTLRSSDLFLGLPFNIASTALLTQILAHILHIPASEISLSICDAHIYEEHIPQVNKQIARGEGSGSSDIYDFPKVIIKKAAPLAKASIEDKLKWIECLVYEDFELSNYKCGAPLSAIMK
jgi:thymidylate synthase